MEKKKFDLIVLGGGPGGYPAAIRAAQHGKQVALIEMGELGGTCLNRGCTPSKALIAGSEMVSQFAHAKKFGIHFKDLSVDFAQLAKHKDSVVEKMRSGLHGLIAANKITLINGFGKFSTANEIKVFGDHPCTVTAKQIIIATGSEPRSIAAFPFDHKKIHDSTSLLALKELPASLIIVGGGVIGCEFASLYQALGVKVTILELLPSLIATEAQEVAEALTKALTRRGVAVKTGVQVQAIEKNGQGVQVKVADGQVYDGQVYEADMALVAVGRSLNTHGIGLEKIGVQVLANQMVSVNEKMETSVPGIYAVGDIASKWWLAHVASHQGIVAADNACGKKAQMFYHAVPSVIFTDPEIATVGLSFSEAQKQGYRAKIGAFPFQALGKSQAALHTDGFAQIVIDESSGQILGAQVVGYEASTLIAEMTLAIANELTIESLTETIHAHPTIAEGWLEAGLLAEGFPTHYPPKIKR